MHPGREVRSSDNSISFYWVGSRISCCQWSLCADHHSGSNTTDDRPLWVSLTDISDGNGDHAWRDSRKYEPHIPFGVVFLAVIGLFSGVYIGCLSMALAEVLKVIPILCTRTKLQHGIAIIITAMAIGKCLGTLYQMCL